MENTIRHEIKSLRQSIGLSQARFAELVGASMPSVSAWERGFTIPRADRLERIRMRVAEILASREAA